LTLFVYLLSRNLMYAAGSAVLFSFLAWAFRARGKKAEPIMLAIAAVTLSAMHQSSLGALFLLMPDELAPQWWSPAMPVSFFLSSIAAGTALIILVEMWIAKAWRRRLRMSELASMGQITFWSLLAYLVFRLGDMVVRGQLANAFSGSLGAWFALEIVLGGILPLAILRYSPRKRPCRDVHCMTEDASLATHPYLQSAFCLISIVFAAVQPCRSGHALCRRAVRDAVATGPCYSSSVGSERSEVK